MPWLVSDIFFVTQIPWVRYIQWPTGNLISRRHFARLSQQFFTSVGVTVLPVQISVSKIHDLQQLEVAFYEWDFQWLSNGTLNHQMSSLISNLLSSFSLSAAPHPQHHQAIFLSWKWQQLSGCNIDTPNPQGRRLRRYLLLVPLSSPRERQDFSWNKGIRLVSTELHQALFFSWHFMVRVSPNIP